MERYVKFEPNSRNGSRIIDGPSAKLTNNGGEDDELCISNKEKKHTEYTSPITTPMLPPQVLPIVMQYLSTMDTLRLRGVTKHFKTTTDAILQQYAREPSKEIDREPHPPCHRDKSAVSSKIGDLEIRQYIYDFDNFLNQWGSGLNGNGFMTGTLRLSFFRSMFPNTLDNVAISTLLTHQGPNIYKMKYLTDLEAMILLCSFCCLKEIFRT
ncbi:unnamed protein product [Orchesella dallaii]|uniref:F-box domain-containing protein n=1 Tax=Orchesella dallaii TaxID=48710 RepID=A0ABP1RU77_9HEXA